MGTIPTPSTVRAKYPEFSEAAGYSDAIIGFKGEIALELYQGSDLALLFLTCHLLALKSEYDSARDPDEEDPALQLVQPDGGSGVVFSEGVTGQRVQYERQINREGDSFYLTTPWGRQFLELKNVRRKKTFAPRVVR